MYFPLTVQKYPLNSIKYISSMQLQKIHQSKLSVNWKEEKFVTVYLQQKYRYPRTGTTWIFSLHFFSIDGEKRQLQKILFDLINKNERLN